MLSLSEKLNSKSLLLTLAIYFIFYPKLTKQRYYQICQMTIPKKPTL